MGYGGSGMPEPSSDNSEEDLSTTKTSTFETEPSEMDISTTEPSIPESCDAQPKKAKQKTAKGRHCRCRHPHNFPSCTTYFSRVLRQVHTGLSLSHEAVNIMDSFFKDMFEQIDEEAGILAHSNKHRTITSDDIQTAVRLLLPGEIGKYATSEATKSIIRYNTCR